MEGTWFPGKKTRKRDSFFFGTQASDLTSHGKGLGLRVGVKFTLSIRIALLVVLDKLEGYERAHSFHSLARLETHSQPSGLPVV